MTRPPDFRDLVGDEGTPEELERLRRVHDLLVAAGPPPELSPALAGPPATAARVSFLPRRRREAAFVLAAAVAAAAFGIGFFLGDRGGDEFGAARPAIAMHGAGEAKNAHASILVGAKDEVGNWPLRLEVRGLAPLPEGGYYELYLTKQGKPGPYCGAFTVRESGVTTVEFSVPYSLKRYDGWIVTARVPGRGDEEQVLMTT